VATTTRTGPEAGWQNSTCWMHRVDLRTDADVDELFLGWVREAYHLRDR
jgi:hypothetical protein